jgi:hypothetical protein
MIPELTKFEQQVSLIMASGVQFLDFGLQLEPRKEDDGEFVYQEGNRSLVRLQYEQRLDGFIQPDKPGKLVRPAFSMPIEQSLTLLNKLWLPIPIFKKSSSEEFAEGPINWARARIIELDDPSESPENSTHRITIAIDTTVFPDMDGTDYLAPTLSNVNAGATYALAWQAHQMHWFTESIWVNKWLEEVFSDNAIDKLNIYEEDLEEEIKNLNHHAHYLNWLSIIGEKIVVPEIKITLNSRDNKDTPIKVDMVLDVGNSRTCGILIEEHPQDNDGMKKRYELELRDLSEPQHVYAEPFESRLEFAQANFGKDNCSVESGRSNAFVWPTFARVGKEASRLASRRRGTEGPSGLSSPKRYLWDEEPYEHRWRFSSSFDRSEKEPYASAAPFNQLINSTGEALYNEPDDDPVFHTNYSRSSLMMFMLAEVLTQALAQMNSPAQRLKQSHASKPRHLRNIILTIPPSMPKPEREIYKKRVQEAIGLVWKALGWHPEDPPIDGDHAALAWPPFPEVHLQWDEATCGQAVYLYTEIVNNFGGRAEEFFATMRRNTDEEDTNKLTIASIDIGGGTTDLVVTDYTLDAGEDGSGSGAYIVPEQRFRDGFKIAGDEIVLETIKLLIVPAISEALQKHGLHEPETLLSRLIGTEVVSVSEAMHRQQFALQILYPIALHILAEFENCDPITSTEQQTHTIRELLNEDGQPTTEIIEYFAEGVRRETGNHDQHFDILDVPIVLNLRKVHELFIGNRYSICKTIGSLCEIVYLYNCDVLLITGRPSKLPGIQALFRLLMPLPPSRIIPLHGYRTGSWYPFHKLGKINDPKTTAAVGAMLCQLGQGRLPNFFFRSNAFKPYSTVKYMGRMDETGSIKSSSVYYADIDLDNPDYELPDTSFEMRGLMQLGFRQFDVERWAASPLYILSFNNDKVRKKLFETGDVCHVKLKNERSIGRNKESYEKFAIDRVNSDAISINKKEDIKLQLNTLTNVGIGDNNYWLDSGSVYL